MIISTFGEASKEDSEASLSVASIKESSVSSSSEDERYFGIFCLLTAEKREVVVGADPRNCCLIPEGFSDNKTCSHLYQNFITFLQYE